MRKLNPDSTKQAQGIAFTRKISTEDHSPLIFEL